MGGKLSGRALLEQLAMPSKMDSQRWGAEGMSLELLEGIVWEALCHFKRIRNENSSERASG